MKLQKLLFYSHGLHLALLNDPLVSEGFEAWPYGPVNRTVYREFRRYGSKPIDAYALEYDIGSADRGAFVINKAQAQTYAVLNSVWDKYSPFSAVQLSRMTHEDGTPWADAMASRQTVISDALIREYFTSMIRAQ